VLSASANAPEPRRRSQRPTIPPPFSLRATWSLVPIPGIESTGTGFSPVKSAACITADGCASSRRHGPPAGAAALSPGGPERSGGGALARLDGAGAEATPARSGSVGIAMGCDSQRARLTTLHRLRPGAYHLALRAGGHPDQRQPVPVSARAGRAGGAAKPRPVWNQRNARERTADSALCSSWRWRGIQRQLRPGPDALARASRAL
jgi:hypothetical protein